MFFNTTSKRKLCTPVESYEVTILKYICIDSPGVTLASLIALDKEAP